MPGLFDSLASFARPVTNWYEALSQIASQADAEAERRFPGQARDDSLKNAYRHALGSGGFAQLLGANSGIPLVEGAARGAAKLAGYGWEAIGGPKNWASEDFRHDLNANALGIAQSSKAQDFQALADQLESFSRSARKEAPPDATERARAYFTYTK